MIICILGRQPELGLAELESLYGSDRVQPAGEQCALVDTSVDFNRLGGSVKAAKLLVSLSSASRKAVFKKVAELLADILTALPPEGKVKLGISLYGFNLSPYELGGEGLHLKKIARRHGRSVRLIPNESPALSSAQTFHNRLAGELGVEFVIIRDGEHTHIGRVTNVQDIDSYRIRDRERPKRDPFVGMLPPKLAQIIVNLATGKIERSKDRKIERESQEKNSHDLTIFRSHDLTTCILDPFCGTGVVLQEALLMGYDVYGTDLSPKMIDYTTANLQWLSAKIQNPKSKIQLSQADATTFKWDSLSISRSSDLPISIATETYLGQPLGGQQPTPEKFAEIVHETNAVIRDFFHNISPQLAPHTQLCVAVPVWFYNGITHLPVIDELASLGLVRHTFTHTVTPLVYHRENQVTGRELLVLSKGRYS